MIGFALAGRFWKKTEVGVHTRPNMIAFSSGSDHANFSLMSTWYTIGQLAKEAGVPTSTVRYYERVGLLQPDGRSGGNYRLYSLAALERLRFIRAAQVTGFTLDDVTILFGLRDGATEPCKEVQALIEERLADTEQRLKDLHHVQKVLKSSLKMCRQAERTAYCHVIDDLTAASARS